MNKTITLIVLSIITVLGCMFLNFREFFLGSPATVKNLIVTFAYIVGWILVLTISIKSRNRKVIKYCSIFWIITLFLAILTGYINVTGASANWAIPFVILLLGQWYGINFFAGNFLAFSAIIVSISLLMSATAAISIKRIK
ncbi:hypothetical protein HGI79_12400 [Clostridium sp. DJ247]|nr:hypothetical protein [Clostridium sp. DJ247]